jgi:broad specificity phosphatase PhoE
MLYLIRHGEPDGAYGEVADPGLTARGREQAETVAVKLAELGARRAITSPLRRCRQTAAPFERLMETHARIEPAVAEIPTPPEVDDRRVWLRSVLEGTWEEAGPALRDWQARTVAAIATLPADTAVFSHFVAINAIVTAISGHSAVTYFHPGHVSITQITRKDGALRLVALGEAVQTQIL